MQPQAPHDRQTFSPKKQRFNRLIIFSLSRYSYVFVYEYLTFAA